MGKYGKAYIGQWQCAYASGGPCLFDAMYEIAEKFPQKQFEGKMTTMNAGITVGERESHLLTKCQTHGLLHHKK